MFTTPRFTNRLRFTIDHPIVDSVWELYAKALKHFGPVATLIERDDNLPPFEELMAELSEARSLGQRVLGEQRCLA